MTMAQAIIPDNEAERLQALRRYEILDTPPDNAFDRIVQLAARLLKVPIAIVSMVDEDRIWFKSRHGIDAVQVTRDAGLCASAILFNEPWIVNDASIDPRALANPLVATEHGFRFYAAAPLITHDGFKLGTLCVIDFTARVISSDEIAVLEDLAGLVMEAMELRLSSRSAVAASASAMPKRRRTGTSMRC
jgi:GAF domain-containing protein